LLRQWDDLAEWLGEELENLKTSDEVERAAAPIWTMTSGMYGSTACAMLPIRLTVVAPIKRPRKSGPPDGGSVG
jgi:hypothetical protein